MKQDPNNLIWVDLEMTGLEPDSDYIIEVATVITNQNLDILAEGPVIAVHQPDEVLDRMDEWNTRQHGGSGLTRRVRESGFSSADAEAMTLEFIRGYVPPGKSPMCGNSICQDRRFMARLMPDLEEYFHYRHIDVSTLKELGSRWYPEVAKGLTKEARHLALEDIYDSIKELAYYREHLFRP